MIGILCLTVALISPAAQEATAQPDFPAPKDTIEIVAITPTADTPIDRGKKITFDVTVEYELVSRRRAFIKVVAIDEKLKPIAELSLTDVRFKLGRSTHKSTGKVKVPKQGDAIRIVALLYELVPLGLGIRPVPLGLRMEESAGQGVVDPTTAAVLNSARLPKPIVATGVRFKIR